MKKIKEINNTNLGSGVKEMVKSFVIAIVLALLFRSFLFEPFYIPSGSMKSTLLVGDYVFVSKYSYGYSRYSFPLGLPLFSGRILDKEPQRGDVIVFRLPSNPDVNYIKRLVGLPGDLIQVKDGVLYINNQALPKVRVKNFVDLDAKNNGQEIPRYIETMPNNLSYYVLDQTATGALDNTGVYEVPPDQYFFMGDNRDNSQDSRVLDMVGFVPRENILGPARIIFFSTNAKLFEVWKWFSGMRFDRFLQKVNKEVKA